MCSPEEFSCRNEGGADREQANRRAFLQRAGVSAMVAIGVAAMGTSPLRAMAGDMGPSGVPKPENVVSPKVALKRLMEGNARYVHGLTRRHEFLRERERLTGGQNPYAAILSCSDSRVSPEYAFDSARGDLFVSRVAGNVVNNDITASLEYAVAALHVPVILVLGHEKCGAVDAAVKVVTKGESYPGKIQSLAQKMRPAVEEAVAGPGEVLHAAIVQNVRDGMKLLRAQSTIICSAEKAGKLKVVGGVYRLSTGKVELLDLAA